MRNLVSSKTVRILNILENAYFKPYLSVEDIAVLNKCSKNTVRSDLEFIDFNWNKLLQITLDLHGISIKSTATGDFMRIKKTLLQDEISLRLLMDIYIYPEYTIYDHAVELNYSESHLRKIIAKINLFLSVVSAQVEYIKEGTDSRPVVIANNEIKLFHLMTSLYSVSNYEEVIPLPKVESKSEFEKILNYMNLPITIPMQKYNGILAQLTNLRLSQGFYIRDQVKKDYQNLYASYSISEFVNVFGDGLNDEIGMYFGNPYIEQHQSDFKVVNDVMISLILRITASSPNVDDLLNRYKFFNRRFAIEHGRAYSIFMKTLKRYEAAVGFEFEDYYGEIIYNLYNQLPNLRPYPTYTIGVYSDLGVSHAYSLVQFLQGHFPLHEIEVLQEDSFYDFIVSTVSENEMFEKAIVILVSDLPGKADIYHIYQEIYNKYERTR